MNVTLGPRFDEYRHLCLIDKISQAPLSFTRATDLILEGGSICEDGLRPAPQRNEGGLSDEDLQVTRDI